jgi:hypothetical protein
MSVRQGEEVFARIQKLNLPMNEPWDGRPAVVEGSTFRPVELRGGIKLTLLSPRPQEMDRLASFWDRSLRGASDVDTEEPSQREEESIDANPLVYVVSAPAPADEKWRGRLKAALGLLLPDARSVAWNVELAPGTKEVPNARMGVVLVSPDALASEAVQKDISTLIIKAADASQMVLSWILLRSSAWKATLLSNYQALGDPNKPLGMLPEKEAAQQLQKIAQQIAAVALERTTTQGSSSSRPGADTLGLIDVNALAEQRFSPDRSVVNNASIAFLAEHHGRSLLVCGDASADVLTESIRSLARQRGVRRLRVDGMVVPRGGSARNLHRQLLELLDCDRYLIATSGERYGLPNRETIARILAFGRADRSVPLTLVFNYRTPTTKIWDDPELQRRWNYRAIYPQHEGGGIKVQI